MVWDTTVVVYAIQRLFYMDNNLIVSGPTKAVCYREVSAIGGVCYKKSTVLLWSFQELTWSRKSVLIAYTSLYCKIRPIIMIQKTIIYILL